VRTVFEPIIDREKVPSSAEIAKAEQEDSEDATLIYRKAFVLYAGLTDEEKMLLRRPAQEVPAGKASALFKRIQPILELLRSTKDGDDVSWEVEELTYDTPLPHVAWVQDLGALALWSADYRFASNPAEAILDLQAQARLGDSLHRTMFECLTQMNMESQAGNMLRQHSAQLTRATMEAANDLVAARLATDIVENAASGELDVLETTAQKLQSQTPEERSKSLELLRARFQPVSGGKIDPALAEKMLDESWVESELELTREIAGQFTEEVRASANQYESWWAEAQSRFRQDHPLAAIVLPAFNSLRGRLNHTQVEQEMYYAGISIIGGEEENSDDYSDPYADKPFFYTQKGGGFELRSHFKENGKPLVMTFLRPKVLAETEPEP
jgi:hypothetical protein